MTASVPTDRPIIGIGAGLAALRTIDASGIEFAYFVDDNPELVGARLAGKPIREFSYLRRELGRKNTAMPYLVVTAYGSSAIRAIFRQLSSLGLREAEDFTDASTLLHLSASIRLRESLGIEPSDTLFESVRALVLDSPIDNQSSPAGSWLVQELAQHQLANVRGDLAEAGVYQGANAYVTLGLLQPLLGGRRYHLFDSFEGLPELGPYDPTSRSHEFGDVDLAGVFDRFSRFASARIHRGLFSETFVDCPDYEYCLAYVDCDLYEPAAECWRYFSSHLSENGMLLFHDYCQEDSRLPPASRSVFTGIYRLLDSLAGMQGISVIPFPETTHALVLNSA